MPNQFESETSSSIKKQQSNNQGINKRGSSFSSKYLTFERAPNKLSTLCTKVIFNKTINMKANNVNSITCICLAVILYACATVQNVNAIHPENSQLALFKDLSGPTSGKIQTLDVICGKNFMTVRAEFSAPFYGIVFSKGTYGQENCIYVKPNSGLTHAAFNVYYDQCGTKPDLQGKFYENTIVIQYGSDIIEAYDEAKRLRCEWFEAYEKPATFKPAIPVADLEVVEMNFQGDDIDCWMEIQEGSGPWSREVSKIVPVGQPMTIVVAINDYNGQFDMRVKSCVAHDGVQQPISLTDEYGCVLRPKMLTPFIKIKNPGGHKKATVLSYSRFLAFKFPDSMTVQIQCTVEVCRHGCADACQRVPSIAATTLQPELSLTAKWPAGPNQAAIEGPRPPVQQSKRSFQEATNAGAIAIPPASESSANENVMNVPYKPARMQFSQRQQPSVDDRSDLSGGQSGARLPNGMSSFQNGNELMAHDDMSISDSSQQASVFNSVAQQQSVSQQQQQQRRPNQQEPPVNFIRDPQRRATLEPTLPSMIDGHIPQYLVPISSRRRPTTSTTVVAPSSTSTTTTSTTPAPTTTSQTPAGAEDNRSNPIDESPEFPAGDDQLTRLSTASEQPQSNVNNNNGNDIKQGDIDTELMASSEQADNKPEASQVKPTIALMPNEQSEQPQASSNAPVESVSDNNSNNKVPSVQAGDEAQMDNPANKDSTSNSKSDSESSISSLKTVEVEIPANEDPVRTLISSSPASGSNSNNNNNNGPIDKGPFNSVRMSNVDLSANNGYSYEGGQQDTRLGSDYKQQGYINEQVIQPRETHVTDKRDKNDDNSNIEAMMAAVKNRFGARSQPHSSVQVAPPPEPPSNHYNHQVSSDLTMRDGAEVVNPDRVLIDRSDDSSSLTEVASSSSVANSDESSLTLDKESLSKSESAISESGALAEESSPVSSVDTNSGRVKPVVGTEELASGPLQIEDRIGAPAPQESFEGAILRLQQQQQAPQTAALVSSQESDKQKAQVQPEQSKPDKRSDNAPVEATRTADSEKPDVASDRTDTVAAENKKQQLENVQQHQQINRSQQVQSDVPQPFPNVIGQQKVIPDPSSSLNTRNSLVAQASEGSPNKVLLPNVVPPKQLAGQKPPLGNDNQQSLQQHQQQQQQQFGQAPKPVAQITNVPINIGFPQNQIPSIQQLSQQLAYFQQQQPSLKPTTTTTTPKPSRGRFSLLSPQAALQAVASRFMPKSASQQAQQQQPKQQPQSQLPISQLPQVFNNMKLTPDQQQKLFASQQQQQQPQQPKYFLQQQTPSQPPMQQPYLPSPGHRYNPGQLQQPQLPQSGPGSLGSGLFGRLNPVAQQQQQQPQSLVRSRRSAMTPTGKKGSGEVGITKTFMVVTGMDLAFLPNATDTELPPILEGRRLVEDDVIYGVCMPVVSLTFVLTCAFWLIVFIFSFCIYMLIKSRSKVQQ